MPTWTKWRRLIPSQYLPVFPAWILNIALLASNISAIVDSTYSNRHLGDSSTTELASRVPRPPKSESGHLTRRVPARSERPGHSNSTLAFNKANRDLQSGLAAIWLYVLSVAGESSWHVKCPGR